MKFGKVENLGVLDLSLPKDHSDTKRVLAAGGYIEKNQRCSSVFQSGRRPISKTFTRREPRTSWRITLPSSML